MTKPFWNAARARQLQAPRKLTRVAPVGAPVTLSPMFGDTKCFTCGYIEHAPHCPTLAKPDYRGGQGVGLEEMRAPKNEHMTQFVEPEQKTMGSWRACPTCGWDPPPDQCCAALDCALSINVYLAPNHIAHRDARKQGKAKFDAAVHAEYAAEQAAIRTRADLSACG